MSLRLRLILAFFALSVLPLGAVTYYSYTTSLQALREAAEREADLLAGELGQRMQLVTAQLSARVEHLMDVAELQAAAEAAADEAARAAARASAAAIDTAPAESGVRIVTPSPGAGQASLNDSIARSLGEAAMLLNNVELQNLRGFGGRGGRGQPPALPGAPGSGGRQGDSGQAAPPGGRGGDRTLTPAGSARRGDLGRPATNARSGDLPATASGARGADPGTAAAGAQTADRIATAGGGQSGAGTGAPPDSGPRFRGPRMGPRPDQLATRGGPPPGDASRHGPPPPDPPSGSGGTQAPPSAASPQAPAPPAAPAVPSPAMSVPPGATTVDASGRLRIDMGAIRREMYRQILPEGRVEDLTPEERQRIAAEVNQRLLGIEQGLKIGAAEIQRRAEQAQQAAAAQTTGMPQRGAGASLQAGTAAAAPLPADTAKGSSPAASLQRRSTLSGSRIDVKVERDGEVIRQMNAEINLPNVIATVFATTRSDRGEVPFAVAKDGTIFTRTEADRSLVSSFGDVAKPEGPPSARQRDWIIVTTEDKSGSGLRLGIARPVTDSLATLRRTTARNAGLGLLFIGLALVGIVPLSTRLTKGLTVLSDGVARIARGDYRARVPVRGRDEVGQLALAFNRMAEDVERHHRVAVEQERIRRELELGRQIQAEMLPHAPLKLGLTEVQGVSVPAREVGGDFFNYFVLDNGQIALLMGDVSGKGVGAALLMANIQAALKVRLGLGQDLSAVADALDRDIDANSPGPVYATLFIGLLDPSTRRLRYVNAGHNPQYVMHAGGLERMAATGLPVGLLSGRGYHEQAIQLAAGDLIFLYTDGCVEAENERGEMFGAERFEPLLVAAAAAPNPLMHVESAIRAFRGQAEPGDDATLMTVRVG